MGFTCCVLVPNYIANHYPKYIAFKYIGKLLNILGRGVNATYYREKGC